mgnify:CR=1 FL=1
MRTEVYVGKTDTTETYAEWLLKFGRGMARARRRSGGRHVIVTIDGAVADDHTVELAECFARASDWIKLRALVEDWGVERIEAEVSNN